MSHASLHGTIISVLFFCPRPSDYSVVWEYISCLFGILLFRMNGLCLESHLRITQVKVQKQRKPISPHGLFIVGSGKEETSPRMWGELATLDAAIEDLCPPYACGSKPITGVSVVVERGVVLHIRNSMRSEGGVVETSWERTPQTPLFA